MNCLHLSVYICTYDRTRLVVVDFDFALVIQSYVKNFELKLKVKWALKFLYKTRAKRNDVLGPALNYFQTVQVRTT